MLNRIIQHYNINNILLLTTLIQYDYPKYILLNAFMLSFISNCMPIICEMGPKSFIRFFLERDLLMSSIISNFEPAIRMYFFLFLGIKDVWAS